MSTFGPRNPANLQRLGAEGTGIELWELRATPPLLAAWAAGLPRAFDRLPRRRPCS